MPGDRYHFYDREGSVSVPTINDPHVTETKQVYSLKKAMSDLRAAGAAKGIVDAGVEDVGQSHEGRKLWALKVGKGSAKKVLFTGCHHAREWISVEVPFLLAEYLINNYTSSPTTDKERWIKYLLDNRQIWFVPMVNPDGHEFSTRKNRWWRAARKPYVFIAHTINAPRLGGGSRTIRVPANTYFGVDINRNYATSNWGQETFAGGSVKTSRDPRDGGENSVWCGPSAQSEVEGKAIADLINTHLFKASVTYHNFSQLLLYPDAASADAFVQFVGNGMDTLIRQSGNPYTYQSGSALYPTTGDAMEFAYEKVPGRPSYCPELRPKDTDPMDVWFSGLPEAQIQPCFEENLSAALAVINCAGQDTASSTHTSTTPSSNGNRRLTLRVVQNCWRVFSGWVP